MSLLTHALTGLAQATPLFLVAAGLTLVFRAARLLDLGQIAIAALGTTVATRLPLDPALAIIATPAFAAVLGAALEIGLFRRLYRAPVLSQLLVSLGLFLLIQDAAPLMSRSHVAPDPAWRHATFAIGALPIPIASLALIALGPVTFGLLSRLRPDTAAPWSRTLTVALGAALSGLGGVLLPLAQHASPPPALGIDLLADVLLVLLLGGLGSLPGAFIAALVIGLAQALIADPFPDAALILPVAATAALLLVRPNGLLGHPSPAPEQHGIPIRPTPKSAKLLFAASVFVALAAPLLGAPTALVIDGGIAILFAAGLHFLLGPGGIPAFGHAAFLVIGTYAAASFVQNAQTIIDIPVLAAALIIGALSAGLAALLVGAILARLSAPAVAMLTLIVAHLVGTVAAQLGPIVAITPLPWSNLPWAPPPRLPPALSVWLTLVLCLGVTLILRRVLYAPFGYAVRAARDNPARAAAIGLPIPALRLAAFTIAGAVAGLAGALTAITSGTVLFATIGRSAEALVMLAFGGLQAIAAPVVGAVAYGGLIDTFPPATLLLGPALIALPLLLPDGIAGTSIRLWRRAR